MPLGEFSLIQHYFERHAGRRDDVLLGIGDDAALVRVAPGQELALAIDTLVAGVHFPHGTDPAAIGHKALAVNLSDLAAMGAEPAWLTVALTLPAADPAWLEGFSRGLVELARVHGMQLIGGDTTRGPLTVSVQVHGLVPTGQALRRSGARPGDRVYVTGALGGAALGLAHLQERLALATDDAERCRARLDRPQPRLAAGLALRGLASAAIDVSDGLLADLGHILAAAGVGCSLDVDAVPQEPLAGEVPLEERLAAALAGGDDYELCFTAPPEHAATLEALCARLDCGCRAVGTIEAEPGLRLHHRDGREYRAGCSGYEHFTTESP